MKLFRILIVVFVTTFGATVFADTEEKSKDLVEKAKEINPLNSRWLGYFR